MANTRIGNDPCRIAKELQEWTGPGRYQLDAPGNGTSPCYMDDPYIRMQKWGANLRTHSIDIQSSFLNLDRPLNRDCITYKYASRNLDDKPIQYPSCQPFTDQTRATNPAWTARDLEQNHFYYLPLNPQENVCYPFQNNLSTRILEKDYYVACLNKSNSLTPSTPPSNVFTNTSQ